MWRLEIQFMSEVLRRLGLGGFSKVKEFYTALWCYALDDWLRLTLPNLSDETRARWPIHPLWGELSSIDFGGPQMPRLRKVVSNRAPSEGKILRRAFGSIASFMALRGISDYYEGCVQIAEAIHERITSDTFFEGGSVKTALNDRIAARRREWNLAMNPSAENPRALEAAVRAYVKASRG